jgi:hypothetical protein
MQMIQHEIPVAKGDSSSLGQIDRAMPCFPCPAAIEAKRIPRLQRVRLTMLAETRVSSPSCFCPGMRPPPTRRSSSFREEPLNASALAKTWSCAA